MLEDSVTIEDVEMMGSKTMKTMGRPPKFSEPRRPITVTLPERILQKLSIISDDRAQALAKAVDTIIPDGQGTARPQVELVPTGFEQSLIIVGPSKVLRDIPWINLIEIAPARFLIAIPPGTAIEKLEIALLDALEHLGPNEDQETALVMSLREHLNVVRRTDRLTKGEILFVAK